MNSAVLGVVETEAGRAARNAPGSKIPKDIEDSIPLGRWGRPDEVANAVVYLSSPLSSYTTGHEIIIDGGATARFPLRLHGVDRSHLAG
jgi:NAD(P)-dependent dehydrogenase (short-subunit alcohol dehydrogenase family)